KGYSDTAKSAQLDKERLLGYVRHIKEIQTETNNRLEPLYREKPRATYKTALNQTSKKEYTVETKQARDTQATTPTKPTTPTAPAKQTPPTKPAAAPPAAAPPAAAPNYTGLLVDARGLQLKPTLAPSILNRGKEKMYGIGVVPTKVTKGSTVDYLQGNLEYAKKYNKINDHPLVIKGIEVVNETDVMIGNDDEQKLVLIRGLLEKGKVVILI
ncbi:MAG: hypothetical protein GY757_24650, partial [bacterium]|nr:hypothetical protein [bacterium]